LTVKHACPEGGGASGRAPLRVPKALSKDNLGARRNREEREARREKREEKGGSVN
jgi:hypothetical protein